MASGVVVLLIGFPAIAEVDRNTTGRRSLTTKPVETAGDPSRTIGFVTGPLLSLIEAGSLGTEAPATGLLEEACEWDCDRERGSLLLLPFRLSVLFVDRWPGVWLREGPLA